MFSDLCIRFKRTENLFFFPPQNLEDEWRFHNSPQISPTYLFIYLFFWLTKPWEVMTEEITKIINDSSHNSLL